VDRRDARHQKKADQIRRERKKGNVKAVANDLCHGVVHYKSRRGASSDEGDDHEVIVVSDGPSDDDNIPDTRETCGIHGRGMLKTDRDTASPGRALLPIALLIGMLLQSSLLSGSPGLRARAGRASGRCWLGSEERA
jgi:hypothetical protein